MHKGLIVLVLLILITGCVSPQATRAIVTQTTQQVPETTVSTVTSTATPAPTIQTTTAQAPKKPLSSTVTLSGTGDSSGSFQVQASGRITISAKYSQHLNGGKTGCTKTKPTFRIALVGSSLDMTLLDGPVGLSKSATKTVNIVSPGSYRIQATGCYGWEAVINNA